jgi:hypothetical protein
MDGLHDGSGEYLFIHDQADPKILSFSFMAGILNQTTD